MPREGQDGPDGLHPWSRRGLSFSGSGNKKASTGGLFFVLTGRISRTFNPLIFFLSILFQLTKRLLVHSLFFFLTNRNRSTFCSPTIFTEELVT